MFSSWRFRGTLPVICVLVGALLAPVGARATSLASDPLTVAGVQWLDGGQQEYDQLLAARLDPQAVYARQRSRTAFEHLSSTRVAGLLARTFPDVVNRPSGGASAILRGARVLGYASSHAIEVALPGDRRGIVESSAAVAKRAGNGRFAPIDLAVVRSGGGFAPANPDLRVSIPGNLSSGVGVPAAGVSLTPVTAGGHALRGSGALVNASVVYANALPATDALVKPTATGFQLDAALRSLASPQRLYYSVGVPMGSKLLSDRGSGAVRVVRGHSTLATISAPSATDAAGTPVPARMSVVDHTILVSVAHRSGSYLYPIEVDPEVNDSQLAETTGKKRSNWEFKSSNEARFAHKAIYEGAGKERLETSGVAEYAASEFAYWAYETNGNSKIYELKTKTSAKNKGNKIESFLEYQTGATRENKKMLSNELEEPEYAEKVTTFCAWNASKVEECLPTSGKEKNAVRFQQSATANPGASFKFSDTMSEGIVSITEPSSDHASTSFNTTSPEVEGEVIIEGKKVVQKRTNALYGSGSWLTNSKGALQMISKDPGIGVSATHLEYEKSAGSWERLSEHNYLEVENACQGVQCYPEHAEYWTLDAKLPDGEDKIRYRAQEAMAGTESLAEEAASTKTVKVDTAAPHGIFLNGLPWGNELSEKPYKLVAEATDGVGTTVAGSGIKKLALFINGVEQSELGTQTGCTIAKGACTAKAEWSINGAELGAGHHAIVIVATDNAGNESRLEETISIHHSTPVALGPGSVDLQSGDYALSATDVNMGSGLTVGRNHSSRATQAGEEGPLGPQWSLNLGTTESLVEMVDGSLMLTDASGKQAIFAKTGAGEFEPPVGDSNLKLTLEENKETKTKLAYYLEDAAKHTKTKFTLPGGATKTWVPSKQEGTVATDTVSFSYQTASGVNEYALPAKSLPDTIVTGPDGELWFDRQNQAEERGWIAKIGTSGTPITEYSMPFGAAISFATGPEGNVWFTSPSGIGKITSGGTITEYSTITSGIPEGITTGPDGNLWFTAPSANKIGKSTTSGAMTAYSLPAGSEPSHITAGPDGNLWFTDSQSRKIGKITTSGAITEYGPASTSPVGIVTGPDGKLWVAAYGKIDKITTSGAMTEYTLPTGSDVHSITAGPDGNLWYANFGKSTIGKITTSGAVTEYALPAESGPDAITVGPDRKLWFVDEFSSKVGTITTAGVIVEPTEELAPVPAGVSCSPEMKAGCRSLKFKYATTTTATGEAQSEWGEYKGRLAKVLLDAYEPVSKKMQETAVAEYSYDKLGRLRVEWDPRISPTLKTSYGYDAEGHVTALTPPGQESWAFIYGASQGDAGTGRLLKVVRAPASEALWAGENVKVKPLGGATITGSPIVGVRMTVSDGSWTGSPVAYGYQWEDCGASGKDCAAISGASNANYTPTIDNEGHKLRAVVTAINGGGSATVASILSAKVEVREFTEFSLPSGSSPFQIASGPDGNLWFTDVGTGKIGKITISGAVTEYATENNEPEGITSGPDNNLWFASHASAYVNRITTSGTVTKYALASGHPEGIVTGPDGNLWFTNGAKIGKITTSGTITEYTLTVGSSVGSITTGPDGNLWYGNSGKNKIGKITTSGTITEYSLPAGSNPYGITSGPDGNLWFTDNGTNKVGKITTSGTITEYALAATSAPRGIASSRGSLWVAEYGTTSSTGKMAKITTGGAVTEYSLPAFSKPNGIAAGQDGNLWVTENGTNKILRFNPPPLGSGEPEITEGAARVPAVGYALEYGTPLSGTGLPNLTSAEIAKWGQTDEPAEATAILPPDAKQGWPASSYARATIYYLDDQGRAVNVASPSTATYGSVATTEYNEFKDVARSLSPNNRQKALEAGGESVDVAKSLSTYYSYREKCSLESESNHETEAAEAGTRLCDVEGPQHTVKYVAGGVQKESLARLHTKYFYDENAPSGETYNLMTRTSTLAKLANEEEVEVRKAVTSYSGQSNLGWKLRAPTSVTVDPEGKKLTTTTLYNSATAQVTETRAPAGSAGNSPHDTKLIYYSAAANTEGFSSCGEHPEWAGLLCETLPAKQPETSGVPNLPVTTTTYNMFNEPLVITETFGSTVRTKTKTYDAAGRLATSETTSTANTALPKLTDEYNSKTGVLEKLSTTVEAKTQNIISSYNNLGQLVEYTDADGNIAKYRYAGPENDWLLEEVADGSNSGTGKQSYSYNSTTKQLEELTDSAAGVFKATYDAEGNMLTETYPNAMCANTAYNSVGEAVGLEYIKTSVCSEKTAPVWFSEARVPSVRGETFSRSSTLAGETYAYDSVGRLTETQETPSGEGCSERLYGYDEEGNRTSQTSRAPGGEGKCATAGGTVLEHSYDAGNRLTDAGIGYDSFGDITKLPAGDAEGHELSSSYYVDGAVSSQTQNGVTNNYKLDPEGRTRETTSGASAVVSHYDGSGQTVVWTSETGGKSTRSIPGIDGSLAAVQTNGGTAVLQLHDLQGNITATAALSSSETKLLSTYNSTEFGAPNKEKAPPKFAWLGAGGIASSFTSGVITYGATSYVPQIGRALQSEVVEAPGIAPHGTGAGAAYVSQVEPWVFQGAAAEAAEAPGLEAAREQAALEAATRAVDPIVFMNRTKAKAKGEAFLNIAVWAEIASLLDIPESVVELVGSKFGESLGLGDAFVWLHDAGEKLIKCAENKRWQGPYKVNICRFEYGELENTILKVKFVDFSSEPDVEECVKPPGEITECPWTVYIYKVLEA
jgi:streptogramin lyase